MTTVAVTITVGSNSYTGSFATRNGHRWEMVELELFRGRMVRAMSGWKPAKLYGKNGTRNESLAGRDLFCRSALRALIKFRAILIEIKPLPAGPTK